MVVHESRGAGLLHPVYYVLGGEAEGDFHLYIYKGTEGATVFNEEGHFNLYWLGDSMYFW